MESLRAWLLWFVDAVETKQIIAPVLNTLVADPKKVFEASHAQTRRAAAPRAPPTTELLSRSARRICSRSACSNDLPPLKGESLRISANGARSDGPGDSRLGLDMQVLTCIHLGK